MQPLKVNNTATKALPPVKRVQNLLMQLTIIIIFGLTGMVVNNYI